MSNLQTRDSFIFYRSFYEAIQDLPKENQLELYNAIAQYSLNFEDPTLNGLSNTIFKLIKPQIEANRKRYLNGKKPKNKQKESKEEAKEKQKESKEEANKNENKNKNENDNELIIQNEKHFEEFWIHYTPIECNGRSVPKGSKKEAKAEYKKQIKKHDHNQIMQGLNKYLTSCKENSQLTLHAVRFLKKEVFLEEFETATVQSNQKKTRSIQDAYNSFMRTN